MNGDLIVTTIIEPSWLPPGGSAEVIRTKTLPELSLITSVHIFLFEGDNLLMITHQTRNEDVPGGHIEPGESIEGALARELYEESAATAKNARLFAVLRITVPQPPPGYRYPSPASYLCCYIGEVDRLDPFLPKFETTARHLLSPEKVRRTSWYTSHQEIYELALEYTVGRPKRS